MPQPLDASTRPTPLFDVAATREIERQAAAGLPAGTLMQRAGRATARLALALAPHARHFVIACGPGNNGGDGLDAAARLRARGKVVTVIHLGDPARLPQDAQAALQRAQAAQVRFATTMPAGLTCNDLCIDALLGIGASRAPANDMAQLLGQLHAAPARLLSVDVPTGLDADSGQLLAAGAAADSAMPACRRHTLTLLTCKPGLFTGQGRDACGRIWFDDLGAAQPDTPAPAPAPAAWLNRPQPAAPRAHASHKGSYGSVAVVGGAADRARGIAMQGAALLAASAALHAGAGRVHVSLLDEDAALLDPQQPELMFRRFSALPLPELTVVAGCGGGDAIIALMDPILATAGQLVLDADGLNAVARSRTLQQRLAARGAAGQATVLTPHPLEAARLLQATTAQVQDNRLHAAQALAKRYGCTVVLKGSGTVVTAPGHAPRINPSGNARLACAGTGDVLAGFIAAGLASGSPPLAAACLAVYQHGAIADAWPAAMPLTAAALATRWPAAAVA